MDPIENTFAPGAGTQPAELRGRDRWRADVQLALATHPFRTRGEGLID